MREPWDFEDDTEDSLSEDEFDSDLDDRASEDETEPRSRTEGVQAEPGQRSAKTAPGKSRRKLSGASQLHPKAHHHRVKTFPGQPETSGRRNRKQQKAYIVINDVSFAEDLSQTCLSQERVLRVWTHLRRRWRDAGKSILMNCLGSEVNSYFD